MYICNEYMHATCFAVHTYGTAFAHTSRLQLPSWPLCERPRGSRTWGGGMGPGPGKIKKGSIARAQEGTNRQGNISAL